MSPDGNLDNCRFPKHCVECTRKQSKERKQVLHFGNFLKPKLFTAELAPLHDSFRSYENIVGSYFNFFKELINDM